MHPQQSPQVSEHKASPHILCLSTQRQGPGGKAGNSARAQTFCPPWCVQQNPFHATAPQATSQDRSQELKPDISVARRLLQHIFQAVITHSNYVFNCCTLISPQPIITAYSCKPNQGKPAYWHKSCNEKYNDFTNKTWIRMHICDKHFVSRRIENDFLSWRLFQAHLTQSVPLRWCAVSYTHQVISG